MLLAFDTATAQVTVALYDGDRVVAEFSSQESMRHGEMLAPGIETVLAEAGVAATALTQVAVGVGPGPFTGLRVGLVSARTFGYALGIPVHGVCSLDILAAEVADLGNSAFGVATDARRKEVYWAQYADGVRTIGPLVAKPTDVATDLPVVGQGALLYPESFGHPVGPAYPKAAVLAQIVAEGSAQLLPPEPLYLRRPDAAAPGKPKRVS